LPNWTALTEIETRRIHTKKSIVRVCHERRSDLHFMKKLETRSGPFENSTRKQQATENSRCKYLTANHN
jgi:hypothetical protein